MTANRLSEPRRRVGVFTIGARGAVASCVALGHAALRSGRIPTTGLVTARPMFDRVPLAGFEAFVPGGVDVREGTLYEAAMRMAAEGVAPRELVEALRPQLDEMDRCIVPGFLDAPDGGETGGNYYKESLDSRNWPARKLVTVIQQKIAEFKKNANVDTVIVLNLASTEAVRHGMPAWDTAAELEQSLDAPGPNSVIPISSIYAYAAMTAGYSYINFTPSVGARPRAFEAISAKHKVVHAGCDGKTGETLMKTVLAPMFRDRNLQVLAWEGYNMLGNGDGRTLADPAHKAGKIANKDQALRQILGDSPDTHTRVSIDYVPSLGDWKTAWDFIHFAGFFGTRMTLQFTWAGSDSALAAPLVIDLLRITDLAQRRGETGALQATAPFFKSPLGCATHDFHAQNQILEAWAKAASE